MIVHAGLVCHTCGLDHLFLVRARAAEEGIENYVHHVNRIAGEQHGRIRPNCRTENLDIKLPVSANGVGFTGDPLSAEEIERLKRKYPPR